jgi:serine protease Do
MDKKEKILFVSNQKEKDRKIKYDEKDEDISKRELDATPDKEIISRKSFAVWLALSFLASAFLGGFFGFLAGNISAEKKLESGQDQVIEKDQKTVDIKTNLLEEDAAVVNAVESASPAVVSIIVTKDVPKLDSFFFNPFFNDPFFNPFGYQQENESEMEKREIGGGTGFIVDPEGYIITNKHVVDDETADYTVMMNDGSKLEASVLATDSYFDIAVIKVEGNNLPVVELGDSEKLKIGQTVIAIGNSLGEFRNTVSKGIISGLKRNVDAGDGRGRTETLEAVIQTDAAINPGNSGGPLLDLSGKVIGINVAMAQGAENIGFSIPVNEVKDIYQSVKTTGKIARPYIGVRYMIITDEFSKENNLSVDYGALIVRGERITDLAVIPGSPADKAGLLENDIILEVDGVKINEENDLSRIVRRKKVGDTLRLKILSKGKEKEVALVLEEADN